jgi:hypothetical protein
MKKKRLNEEEAEAAVKAARQQKQNVPAPPVVRPTCNLS